MGILLVGTDFLERSDRALRRAILLGRKQGQELLLVHVVDDPRSGSDPDDYGRAHELLAKLRRTIVDGDGVTCRTQVRTGSIGDALCRAAQESDAALVLIGPHRKAPLRDWFRGSTAENILERTKVPLVVVNAMPAEHWRRHLIPVDFGPAARRAADLACRLPRAPDSRFVFAHVYDAQAREMLSRAFVQGTDREDYLREEADTARSRLAPFVDDLECGQSRLIVREAGGSTAGAIVRIGRDEDSDLIIVSSSNKGVMEKAIVGSVTAGLLREASQDIMIVPASA